MFVDNTSESRLSCVHREKSPAPSYFLFLFFSSCLSRAKNLVIYIQSKGMLFCGVAASRSTWPSRPGFSLRGCFLCTARKLFRPKHTPWCRSTCRSLPSMQPRAPSSLQPCEKTTKYVFVAQSRVFFFDQVAVGTYCSPGFLSKVACALPFPRLTSMYLGAVVTRFSHPSPRRPCPFGVLHCLKNRLLRFDMERFRVQRYAA